MNFLDGLALANLLLLIGGYIDVTRGNRSIAQLGNESPLPKNVRVPMVSIIAAARNEERHIEQALKSLLKLDYPALELVIVNDRSEDRTAEILARLSDQDQRLKIVQVETLPDGWLGKNHALSAGSREAQGELLLFTDADIYMEPGLLKKAVHLLLERNLDHLVASPRLIMPGVFLQMVGLAFMMIFAMFSRPWKACDPSSHFHIGIGAFNLVRATAYHAVGGHHPIRLRPDDDLKLGKLMKMNGFRQDIAAAPELMHVEWYASVREMIVGLEKNAFAGCDYRLWMAGGGIVMLLVFGIWPFLALLMTQGLAWWFYLATVLIILAMQIDCARANRLPGWYAIGWPLAAGLFTWIIARTAWLNLSHGGITWRGTFYPLEELKKNRI